MAITGQEEIGLTIVLTEGFGQLAMAAETFDLLKQHEGEPAALNGATQIRAGVLRPEIAIPLLSSAMDTVTFPFTLSGITVTSRSSGFETEPISKRPSHTAVRPASSVNGASPPRAA